MESFHCKFDLNKPFFNFNQNVLSQNACNVQYCNQNIRPLEYLRSKLLMTTYFLFSILFYFHNHSLFSYFSFFISSFNYPWKMNILIVYLRLIAVVSLYAFILYLSTFLLFHFVYFKSFFGDYIEQNNCFYSFKSSQCEILYTISILHQWQIVKYAREKVLFSLNLQALSLHFY